MPNEIMERGKLAHESKKNNEEQSIEMDAVSVAWEFVRNKKKAEFEAEQYNADPLDIIHHWIEDGHEEWIYAIRKDKKYVRKVVHRSRDLIKDIIEDIDENIGKLVPLFPPAAGAGGAPPGGGGGGGGGGELGGLFGSSNKMIKIAVGGISGYTANLLKGGPFIDDEGYRWYQVSYHNDDLTQALEKLHQSGRNSAKLDDEVLEICMQTLIEVYGENHPFKTIDIKYILSHKAEKILEHVEALTKGFVSAYITHCADYKNIPEKVVLFAKRLGAKLDPIHSFILKASTNTIMPISTISISKREDAQFEIKPANKLLQTSNEVLGTYDIDSLIYTLANKIKEENDESMPELIVRKLYNLLSNFPDKFTQVHIDSIQRMTGQTEPGTNLHVAYMKLLILTRLKDANEEEIDKELIQLNIRRSEKKNKGLMLFNEEDSAEHIMNLAGARKMDAFINRNPVLFEKFDKLPVKWIERFRPTQRVREWAISHVYKTQSNYIQDIHVERTILKLIAEDRELANGLVNVASTDLKIASYIKLIETNIPISSNPNVGMDRISFGSISPLGLSILTGALIKNYDTYKDEEFIKVVVNKYKTMGPSVLTDGISPLYSSGIKNWLEFSKDFDAMPDMTSREDFKKRAENAIRAGTVGQEIEKLLELEDGNTLLEIVYKTTMEGIRNSAWKNLVLWTKNLKPKEIDDLLSRIDYMTEGQNLFSLKSADPMFFEEIAKKLSAYPKKLAEVVVGMYYKNRPQMIEILNRISPLGKELVSLLPYNLRKDTALPSWITGIPPDRYIEAIVIRKKVIKG